MVIASSISHSTLSFYFIFSELKTHVAGGCIGLNLSAFNIYYIQLLVIDKKIETTIEY